MNKFLDFRRSQAGTVFFFCTVIPLTFMVLFAVACLNVMMGNSPIGQLKELRGALSNALRLLKLRWTVYGLPLSKEAREVVVMYGSRHILEGS